MSSKLCVCLVVAYYFKHFIVKLPIFKGEGAVVVDMFVCLMFNNISVISWRSVLIVEETGGPVENHRLVISFCF